MEQKLVRSFRGKSGGLQLAKATNRINIGQVVAYMENDAAIINCHDPYCPIVPACRLKHALHEAHQAFYTALKQYTLTDLLQEKESRLKRLLAG